MGSDPGLAALHDLALFSGIYGMFGGAAQALALVSSEVRLLQKADQQAI